MFFLRSLLFTLALYTFTLIWCTACLLTFFFPYRFRYGMAIRWNRTVIWLARNICGIRHEIKGMENLPDEPVILLSKHQSAWETVFFLCGMQKPLVFVLKQELLRIPFFGWVLRTLRMIPIDRSRSASAFRKIREDGEDRLKEGFSIVIFPEGTRTPVGQKTRYKSGGTWLAIKTGTRVVPVALNSGECWPPHAFTKKPGMITVSIGEPVSADARTPDEMMREVETWIESEMHRISPHAYEPAGKDEKTES